VLAWRSRKVQEVAAGFAINYPKALARRIHVALQRNFTVKPPL
jgi:hypothetical protein